MSADEGLLARWARRKRAAAAEAHGQLKSKNPADDAASLPPGETQPPFDPASLPPVEAIGAGSDIRPFLAAGVPADLTRAALRRAWSADPAVRDFIGLSENAWDFNLPGGVAGFDPLTTDEARRLLAQAIGEPEAADPAPAAEARPAVRDSAEDRQRPDNNASAHRRDLAPDGKINVAAHYESAERAFSRPLPRRGHGGALPK